jgi:hypothetical protein
MPTCEERIGEHVGCWGIVCLEIGVAGAAWLRCQRCNSKSGDPGFEVRVYDDIMQKVENDRRERKI